MNQFKVTLYYLPGTKKTSGGIYSWKVNQYVMNGVAEKYSSISLRGYDKEHKIEQVLRVPLDDVETVVIERKGGKEKHIYRIHRKKTPETRLFVDI